MCSDSFPLDHSRDQGVRDFLLVRLLDKSALDSVEAKEGGGGGVGSETEQTKEDFGGARAEKVLRGTRGENCSTHIPLLSIFLLHITRQLRNRPLCEGGDLESGVESNVEPRTGGHRHTNSGEGVAEVVGVSNDAEKGCGWRRAHVDNKDRKG